MKIDDPVKINTRLTKLEKRVGTIEKDVSILKKDVAILKTDVAELKTDVSILKMDMKDVKNDLHNLNDSLPKWRSEIFNLVDGLAIEIRDGREHRIVTSHQITENRERIEKLECKVFGAVAAN